MPTPPRWTPAAAVALFACAGHAQDCISWREADAPQGPLTSAAMCFDQRRGVAVLFGGSSGSNQTSAQTWEWDGTRWVLRLISPPTARQGHTLTFDTRRGLCVAFGGSHLSNSAGSELWEYGGAAWVRRTEPAPPPRFGHAAAFDAARGETVVFGGRGPAGVVRADTWTWDGTRWLEHAAPGPSPRDSASMAFDEARGVTVLFSGYGPGFAPALLDTWEWDGARWTFRSLAAPNLSDAELYYDPRRQRVRLLGLPAQHNAFLETWEWDGLGWNPVSFAGPPARFEFALAYDAAREGVVMHGGGGYYPRGDSHVSSPAPLAFRAIPQSRRIDVGETLLLSADACGDNPAYQWRRNAQPLIDDGRITGSRTPNLRIDDFQSGDAGLYDAVATSPAGSIASQPPARIELYTSRYCYPDCDTSTGRRVLDILDFICFQNDYAQQGTYACDCDTSQFPCDIFDFLCFMNLFAAGCP